MCWPDWQRVTASRKRKGPLAGSIAGQAVFLPPWRSATKRSRSTRICLNGVLIEGIASTIHSLPERRRRQVAVETIRLLLERLQAGGAI